MTVNVPLRGPRSTRMILGGACCESGPVMAQVVGSTFWPASYVAPTPDVKPFLRHSYNANAKVLSIDVVAGDRIVVAQLTGSSLDAAITCVDDVDGAYTQIGTGVAATAGMSGNFWSLVASATGTRTVTVTTVNTALPVIFALVYEGLDALDSFQPYIDAAVGSTHSNTITTTADKCQIVSFWFQDSANTEFFPGNDFVLRTYLSVDGTRVWNTASDRTVFRQGAFTDAVTTSSASARMGNMLIAFQAAAGTATANATVAFTEAADTASLQTKADAGAVLTFAEAQDTAALTLLEVVATSLAFTEAADTASLQATVTAGLTPLNAILAYTEAQDVAALLAAAVVNGTLTASEAVDTFSMLAGAVAGAVLGATEASDIASLQATARAGAVLAFTEDPDTASLQAAAPTALALVADENPDTCLLYAGEAAPNDAKISLVGMLVNVGTLLNRS